MVKLEELGLSPLLLQTICSPWYILYIQREYMFYWLVVTHQCCIEFHRWRSTLHVRLGTSPSVPCVGKSSWTQWSSAASAAVTASVTIVWSVSQFTGALKGVLCAVKWGMLFHINYVQHTERNCPSSVWLIWTLSALPATQWACMCVT